MSGDEHHRSISTIGAEGKKLVTFKLISARNRKVLKNNHMVGCLPSDSLFNVALGVIRNFVVDVDSFHESGIHKIVCGATDITECLDYSLNVINSPNANIFDSVISITIDTAFSAGPQQKPNAFQTMMSNASTINFLPFKPVSFAFLSGRGNGSNSESDDEDDVLESILQQSNIQDQIKILLRSLFHEVGLGYRDDSEKNDLNTFVNVYSNVLCFVDKFWKSILRVEYHCLPQKYSDSMSLQLLTMTDRK